MENKIKSSIALVSDNAKAILSVEDLLNFFSNSFVIIVLLAAYIGIDIKIPAIITNTLCVDLIDIYR